MKKITLYLLLATSTLFASNGFEGCKELKLSESKSMISCPSGDYEVTYETKREQRDLVAAPTVVKVGEAPKQIIQYITNK
ncbi:MAG: hypothetical protein PHY66_10490 [Aliarcobacter sp.]|nr:hypothetical protein [Aliarcobacter sp.]